MFRPVSDLLLLAMLTNTILLSFESYATVHTNHDKRSVQNETKKLVQGGYI